jgi:2-polyprenyl-3-methyl-5-hydroxy-6-metoxy-1,4-benzoquinol methylase
MTVDRAANDGGQVSSLVAQETAQNTNLTGLTTADYWRAYWAEAREISEFPFVEDIAVHLPDCGQGAFFEVGCAPGGILAQFCLRLGCEAHGIDFAADPLSVRALLEHKGVRVGQLHTGDFLAWAPPRKYDVVASFGFVEHFRDPGVIVDRQFALVRPGGHVVVTMPNYARGQWLLHRLFDPALLEGHNLRCMNRGFLRAAATRNQATLLTARYIGGRFAFCDSGKTRRGWLTERLFWRVLRLVRAATEFLPRCADPLFAPYLIAVYQASDGPASSAAGRATSWPADRCATS